MRSPRSSVSSVDSDSTSKRVRFDSRVVTQTREVPQLDYMTTRSLYYSRSETKGFRRSAKLESLVRELSFSFDEEY